MPALTPRQKQILDYIKGYIDKNGFSPTFEEISHHTKKAFSTVHEHVEALIEKRFLIKKDNSVRGIELNEQTEMVKIPLVGAIAAGRPIEAIEEKETLAVPKNLLARSGEHFVLRVKGDSMINDGVFNGDKVIIRKQNEAENGDMVVALINQEEATLKRFFKEKDKIRLQPANPSFKPIYAKNVTIQGRVISVIRNFGNNEENSDFTENTTSYINQADIKYRKKLGQYFTPKPVREALIEQLPKNINHPKILDPACGTGEFLLTAKKYFPRADLYGWEIDKNLVGISQKNISEAKLECIDSLENEQYRTFDYVIGNPPYFEFTPPVEIKNKFQTIISGRVNIFSLFVYQGLKWLKEGGYLAYVIPPSMNNGAYFAKLRNFIVENANIEYLHVLDDPKLFHKAQQTTMLLILKKGKNKGDYIFKKNGILIFSENVEYLKKAFDNKATLYDLGYEVKTGRVIWNENKNYLTNDKKKGTPLIWAQNIIANALKLSTNDKKPQYIAKNGPDIGPAIVVNRITGTVNSAKLKAALIPPGMKFFAENHVNVITPAKNTGQGQFNLPEKNLKKNISLGEIIRQLSSPEKLKVVRCITGNTQISKTELEKLFPLDI